MVLLLRPGAGAGVSRDGESGTLLAEPAEVVTGTKPGRRDPEKITVFDSTGTALEDAAAAAVVDERALAAGAGRRLDFAG